MTSNDNQEDGKHTLERETPIHRWLGGKRKTSRLTLYQRRRIRKFCMDRDGRRCMICLKEELSEPIERSVTLQIDHIDGINTEHWSDNLRLVHSGCNQREYHKTKVQSLSTHERENVRTHAMSTSLEIRQPLSAEIAKNQDYEPFFRRKCFELLLETRREGKPITRKQMRQIARTETGCSLQTSYSYLETLVVAPNAPMKQEEDIGTGTLYVTFKDPRDYKLTIDELMCKYPKEGKRYSQGNKQNGDSNRGNK